MTKMIAVGLSAICVMTQLGCVDPGYSFPSIGYMDASGRPPPPGPPPVARGDPLPTRDTLVRNQKPFPYYGAYGYLVFTVRPSASEKSRYVEVCDAYRRGAEAVGAHADVPPGELMVTFWLLGESPDGDQAGCEELLAKYDYATAKRIASAVGKLDASGPLLVAWDRPFGWHKACYPPLVFDLSTFSEEDLGRGLRIWYERICRMPQAWNKGWRLVVFREEFRSLLEQYGSEILEIVS